MYAKAIIPAEEEGGLASPLMFITLPVNSTLAGDLHQLGWHPYGGELDDVNGQVQIMPDVLLVVIGGQVALRDDTDPVSPPGWWEAVDAAGGRAAVVFVPAKTPIGEAGFGQAMIDLVDDTGTAQALLPVTHLAI